MKSTLSKRKSSKAFAKLVVNSVSGKVLGVHFVGPEAAEIVQVFPTQLVHQSNLVLCG
jgi:pyruvate/2-oxoglutarate dehydrogenase complex dihydrolipoamide dehydrogenase (E3) component